MLYEKEEGEATDLTEEQKEAMASLLSDTPQKESVRKRMRASLSPMIEDQLKASLSNDLFTEALTTAFEAMINKMIPAIVEEVSARVISKVEDHLREALRRSAPDPSGWHKTIGNREDDPHCVDYIPQAKSYADISRGLSAPTGEKPPLFGVPGVTYDISHLDRNGYPRGRFQRNKRQNITGTNQEAGNLKIVEIQQRPPRRHLYVSGLSPHMRCRDIIDYCKGAGAPVAHIRQVNRPGMRFSSFHCVFTNEYFDKCGSNDFWPQGVLIRPFKLNDEAREWLQNVD